MSVSRSKMSYSGNFIAIERKDVFQYVEYFFGILISFLLCFLPKVLLQVILKKIIIKKYYYPRKNIYFFKSGRSALYTIFRKLYENNGCSDVLIPDYLCNVVPQAAKIAGHNVLTYHSLDAFEADIKDLVEKIDTEEPVIVLLASIAGSQNNKQYMVDAILKKNRNAFIILDECQNLITDNEITDDPRVVIVFSFNSKQIHGVMGGGICSTFNYSWLSEPQKSIVENVKLELRLILSVFARVRDRIRPHVLYGLGKTYIYPFPKIEYSNSQRIDFRIDGQKISKISLARALVCILGAEKQQRIRSSNYKTFLKAVERYELGQIIKTERIERSPYIPMKMKNKNLFGRFSLKGPYAMDNSPNLSLRPSIVYFFNEGFCPIKIKKVTTRPYEYLAQ